MISILLMMLSAEPNSSKYCYPVYKVQSECPLVEQPMCIVLIGYQCKDKD